MTVLKVIGIVIGAILLLIAAVSAMPVSIRLTSKAHQRLKYKLYILGIPVPLGKKKENPTKKPKDTQSGGTKKKAISKPALDELAEIVDSLAKQFFWLLKRFKISKLHILSISAGDDAADVAMQYGTICAVLYPTISIIEANMKIKRGATDINVVCDFERADPAFELDIKASIIIFHLLKAALSVLFDAVKATAAKEANNE